MTSTVGASITCRRRPAPSRRTRTRASSASTSPGSVSGCPRCWCGPGAAGHRDRAPQRGRLRQPHRGAQLRGPQLAAVQPAIAGGVLARVVRAAIDEAPLDLPVADLEYVTPAAGRRLGNAGPPRAVLVLPVAGPLADEHVSAREDPVEVGVAVSYTHL